MEQIVKRLDLTGCVRVLYRIYWRISFKLQAYTFYNNSVSKNFRFLRPEWNISLKVTGLLGVGVYGVRLSVKEGCYVIR